MKKSLVLPDFCEEFVLFSDIEMKMGRCVQFKVININVLSVLNINCILQEDERLEEVICDVMFWFKRFSRHSQGNCSEHACFWSIQRFRILKISLKMMVKCG